MTFDTIISGNIGAGEIGSVHMADGALGSGNIGSGQISQFAMASGAVNSGHVSSGAVLGSLGGGALTIASGSIGPSDLGSGAIQSGHIASGQIGNFHVASGAITSGRLGVTGTAPDGTRFLRDDFTWAIAAAAINSGDIGSGKIASGAVQGFFGSTRQIASGTIGSFDLGSGAVVAGSIGSGAVVSGNIASGVVGQFHVASGAITSGRLGVAGVPDGTKVLRDDFTWAAPGTPTIGSGDIGSGKIASGAVQGFFGTTRHIASGTIGSFDLGSGAVVSGNIASGQVGNRHIDLAAVGGILTDGQIKSGSIGFEDLGNSFIDDTKLAPIGFAIKQYFQAVDVSSGYKAVCLASGSDFVGGIWSPKIALAQPGSGLRMPAIGVADFGSSTASGAFNVPVTMYGFMFMRPGSELDFVSGTVSGQCGPVLIVGSGSNDRAAAAASGQVKGRLYAISGTANAVFPLILSGQQQQFIGQIWGAGEDGVVMFVNPTRGFVQSGITRLA